MKRFFHWLKFILGLSKTKLSKKQIHDTIASELSAAEKNKAYLRKFSGSRRFTKAPSHSHV